MIDTRALVIARESFTVANSRKENYFKKTLQFPVFDGFIIKVSENSKFTKCCPSEIPLAVFILGNLTKTRKEIFLVKPES